MLKPNQKGYVGYKMSKRAMDAYADGEMPKSKWTKSLAMMEMATRSLAMAVIADVICDTRKAKDFIDLCLEKTSWHHTGAAMACTPFYSPRGAFPIMFRLSNEEKAAVRARAEEICFVPLENDKFGRCFASGLKHITPEMITQYLEGFGGNRYETDIDDSGIGALGVREATKMMEEMENELF